MKPFLFFVLMWKFLSTIVSTDSQTIKTTRQSRKTNRQSKKTNRQKKKSDRVERDHREWICASLYTTIKTKWMMSYNRGEVNTIALHCCKKSLIFGILFIWDQKKRKVTLVSFCVHFWDLLDTWTQNGQKAWQTFV